MQRPLAGRLILIIEDNRSWWPKSNSRVGPAVGWSGRWHKPASAVRAERSAPAAETDLATPEDTTRQSLQAEYEERLANDLRAIRARAVGASVDRFTPMTAASLGSSDEMKVRVVVSVPIKENHGGLTAVASFYGQFTTSASRFRTCRCRSAALQTGRFCYQAFPLRR